MIVKRLYRSIRFKYWDKERKTYENTIVTDYLGWFLFGIIPIYLIELDKSIEFDFEECEKETIQYGINKKYGYIIEKSLSGEKYER